MWVVLMQGKRSFMLTRVGYFSSCILLRPPDSIAQTHLWDPVTPQPQALDQVIHVSQQPSHGTHSPQSKCKYQNGLFGTDELHLAFAAGGRNSHISPGLAATVYFWPLGTLWPQLGRIIAGCRGWSRYELLLSQPGQLNPPPLGSTKHFITQ